MKSISIVNLKGGVGKTVTAVNLAGILAADYGKRVLLVDSDPQGDASQYIGVAPDACSTADLFDGGTAYYEDVIQHTIYRDLDIIPSDMQLASVDLDADIDRKQAVRVYADLRDALVEDDAYDVMIFDCPPSFSLPCISAIAASDTVIVPIKPGAFEMSGMRLLADQIASVRNTGLAKRSVFGLLTIWHNADATRQSEYWLREHSPIPLFYRKIRRTDKVTESTYAAQPVTRWSPPSVAFGTKVTVQGTGTSLDGETYTVNDRGGAIQIENGVYHFDLLMRTNAECNSWGRKTGTAILGGTSGGGAAQSFVNTALGEVGYREGSGNRTKYGAEMGCDGVAWCVIFVCWCAKHASAPIPTTYTAVSEMRSYFERRGKFKSVASGYRPKAGDLMIIGSSHIGIVLSGGASSCETVEGNYSDGVGRVKRSYSEITGFCCPW